MKSFKVFGINGKEVELILGKVIKEKVSTKVEVIRLKAGGLLIENEIANLVFTDADGAILNFSRELNKAFKITNFKDVIDYIWENSGMDRLGYLYKFTTEFNINYCE